MAITLSAGQLAAIRAEIQQNYYERSILGPSFVDDSELIPQGSVSYTYPIFSKATLQDKASGVALTDTTMTLSGDTLTLNKHKGRLVSVEDIDEAQSVPNLGAAIVRNYAEAWVEQFESDLWTEAKNVSAATPDHILQLGSTGNALNVPNIVAGHKLLNDQKLPRTDRFLVVSTAQEAEMLQIDNFIRADAYGSPESLRNGEIGRVYGYTVLVSTSAADAEAMMYHRSHVAYAIQRMPKFESDRDINNLADKYAISLLYGIKARRSGIYGVLFNATGT